MADFEENVAEMVRTTREAAAVATESGGDETTPRQRTRPGTRPAVPGREGGDGWRRDGSDRWGNVYGRN